VIVPVDDQGRILFVRQFRIGAGEDLLELPAGLLEEGERPEASANRELQEEIGMAPKTMVKLGEFYMVPGYSTEKLIAFLASGLYESPLAPDEDEVLELVALPIAEVYELVRAGKMTDGKTLASLLLAGPHLARLSGEKLV
jgi:ADP-ribose pyrophosphatase